MPGANWTDPTPKRLHQEHLLQPSWQVMHIGRENSSKACGLRDHPACQR